MSSAPPPEIARIPITYSIVGVQKAATSTMHTMLGKHPEVAPTFQRNEAKAEKWHFAHKELHFFDDEARDWAHPDYSDYFGSALTPEQRIAGDATPSYIFWPGAMDRMHGFDPAMKLIASFRDPIERTFSQWSMGRKRANKYPEFTEAIRLYDRPEFFDGVPTGSGKWTVHRQSMVIRGLYGEQLTRAFTRFPRERWLLLSFHDFVADYAAGLDAITDFLGLRRFAGLPGGHPPLRTNPTPADQDGVPPSEADIGYLVERFSPDLATFEQLSGMDISAWPTRRIERGEMTPRELVEKFARKFVRDD